MPDSVASPGTRTTPWTAAVRVALVAAWMLPGGMARAESPPAAPIPAWQMLGSQLRPSLHPPGPAAAPAAPKAETPVAPETRKRSTARPSAGPAAPLTSSTVASPAPKAVWPPVPPAARMAAIGKSAARWTTDEIKSAKAECDTLLKNVKAVVVPEEPLREGTGGACGDAAPLRVMSIGKTRQVVFSPAPLMSCRMVAAMYRWLEQELQPLARKHLKSQIVQIDVMSDYSCRAAYGRRGGRLSEHGRANALDFNVIRLADLSTVSVLSHWGPTKRDILAAKAAAEAARAKAKSSGKTMPALPSTEPVQPTAPLAPGGARIPVGLGPPSRLGGPKAGADATTAQAGRATVQSRTGGANRTATRPLAAPDAARSRFLRAAHERGCRVFGTILGPEANEAHRNHFHVDMAERARESFCE